MPLYDYHCEKCDFTFEAIERMDRDAVPCLKCDRPAKRIISVSVGPNNASFKEGYYHNFTGKPIYLRTWDDAYQASRKYGAVPEFLAERMSTPARSRYKSELTAPDDPARWKSKDHTAEKWWR